MERRELSAADIYHKFAAQLDKDGFRLYRAAQRSTGFQPYDAFPYLDGCTLGQIKRELDEDGVPTAQGVELSLIHISEPTRPY